MIISHNLMAMNAQRQYNITTGSKAKSTEKLSSGYRVNRAADDAAGLAISEKMRRQIRGLTQAATNAQDGVSLVQTAEGGLNEVHDMLQRFNELAVKASNGTLMEEDREYVDEEAKKLKEEINRVAGSTTFNGIQLFPDDGSSNVVNYNYDINVNLDDGTYTVINKSDTYTSSIAVSSGKTTQIAESLSKYIIPDAAKAVLETFPALKAGKPDINIALDISSIDGAGKTLAYAQFSYYDKGSSVDAVPTSFVMKVDISDFTDENAAPGKEKEDLLKATIQHEVTHSIMQNVMPTQMVKELPLWFVEGTAQLAGGGFSTGWNNELAYVVDALKGETDDVQDAGVSNYLQKYTVDGRPYGHGYLAAAYMGQLASGAASASAGNIATGMNKILGAMIGGKSFEQAVKENTGKTTAQIKSEINSGAPDATKFVKELTKLTGTGAGSILGAGLSAGSQIAGMPAGSGGGGFSMDQAASTLMLQVGSEVDEKNRIEVALFAIGTKSLGLEATNLLSQKDALLAIGDIKGAISQISGIRSYYGATQNRLEHTINNLNNVVENTQAAESKIRDTDMAAEMVKFSVQNILAQAGEAMLAQANQSNQGVLSLLQ